MKKENQAIVITSIIAGVILIVAVLALLMLAPQSSSNSSITVQGVSTIKAMPDLITVYFSINTEGTTSAEASDENSEIYDKLVEEMEKIGISSEEIKTENYNIYPKYNWDDGKQTSDGYQAYRSIKIEISANESEFLSEIIDSGVEAGAGISYINFELSQKLQNSYKAQALKLAAQDAKIKAISLASGFEKSVGRLISVSTSDFGYYPWNVYSATSEDGRDSQEIYSAKETAASINPSEKEITATVSATYRVR
jgi:hypothetical protein